MAMLAPASLMELLEFARSGKELEINRDILSHGALSAAAAGDADTRAFQDAGFTSSEVDEVRDLFEIEPASKFNLSQAEVQRFADLHKKFKAKECEKDSGCIDAVVSTLRGVLRDRLKAYREGCPASSLRLVKEAGHPILPRSCATRRTPRSFSRGNTPKFSTRSSTTPRETSRASRASSYGSSSGSRTARRSSSRTASCACATEWPSRPNDRSM